MSWPLYKVVFGLRHTRMFAFSGTSGRIIDAVAEKDVSKYGNQFALMTLSRSPDQMAFRLSNKMGNYFLDCNIEGFVLTYHRTGEDDPTTVETVKKQFTTILNNAVRIAEAENDINRIGIVNYYSFDTKTNSALSLVNNILKLDLKGIPDSFLLRYALKNVTDEGQTDTTKSDYSNVILTFESDKSDKEATTPPDLIDLQIDHQIYFIPNRKYNARLIDEHFNKFEKVIANIESNKTLQFVLGGATA
jgi:hypothetical protein